MLGRNSSVAEERYAISPSQVAALRALHEGLVELSDLEVAVGARLLPSQARAALAALESSGLVNSWVAVTGRSGEHLYVLTDEGQAVCQALAQFRGTPPVGAVVRLRQFPAFLEWLSRRTPSFVEMVAD